MKPDSNTILILAEYCSTDDPIAATLADVLRLPDAELNATRPLPRKQVLDIYSIRANINRERGQPIKGFDELITALQRSETSSIVVVDVRTVARHLVAFCDPSFATLFGVLEFPSP